jgi:hypothetical protein
MGHAIPSVVVDAADEDLYSDHRPDHRRHTGPAILLAGQLRADGRRLRPPEPYGNGLPDRRPGTPTLFGTAGKNFRRPEGRSRIRKEAAGVPAIRGGRIRIGARRTPSYHLHGLSGPGRRAAGLDRGTGRGSGRRLSRKRSGRDRVPAPGRGSDPSIPLPPGRFRDLLLFDVPGKAEGSAYRVCLGLDVDGFFETYVEPAVASSLAEYSVEWSLSAPPLPAAGIRFDEPSRSEYRFNPLRGMLRPRNDPKADAGYAVYLPRVPRGIWDPGGPPQPPGPDPSAETDFSYKSILHEAPDGRRRNPEAFRRARIRLRNESLEGPSNGDIPSTGWGARFF